MSELHDALMEFVAHMEAKFLAREAKHGSRSLTLDGNLAKMEAGGIYAHFVEEVGERLCASRRGAEECAREDVDVANLAFLDWVILTRAMRGDSSPG